MEKPKLVYKSYIRSTPEKTWEAICSPEFTRRYWGGMTNVSDWKPGSKWEHQNPDKEVWIHGVVEEVVPQRKLVLTWVDPDAPDDRSLVTFEIEPAGDTVRLTVTHDKFTSASTMRDKVDSGWPRVLSSLKSYLETGTGLDIANCGANSAS